MNTAAARANTPAEPTKRIFYLAMDDLYESQIAKAWSKTSGKTVVFKIPLERLTSEMVIVPVIRNADTRTTMVQEEFDPVQQKKNTKRLSPESLTGEIVECRPVRVGDFWRSAGGAARGGDAFADLLMGALDKVGFIDAINASTADHNVFPRTHHGDQDATLRLTWGA